VLESQRELNSDNPEKSKKSEDDCYSSGKIGINEIRKKKIAYQNRMMLFVTFFHKISPLSKIKEVAPTLAEILISKIYINLNRRCH